MQFTIKTALAMRKLGAVLANSCVPGAIIYLQGPLGAGKTTLVRGFLKKLGFKGHVKSPTFNLFEIYQVKDQVICHFDLYRLQQPEELIYIGIADYFNKTNICLLEWPENGKGFLPSEDLLCCFDFAKHGGGRVVKIISNSSIGERIIKKITEK